MDTCVPNPSLINNIWATSPHSFSIYDQDRPSNVFCGSSKLSTLDIGGLTEEGGLDDNFEDSSLKNILTPELINSMTMTSSTSSSGLNTPSFQWGIKNTQEGTNTPSNAMESFMQLGMDSDLLIPDFFNIDSNDSKFSFPTFDLDSMTSNPPSSCHTPVPSESKPEFLETSYDKKSSMLQSKETQLKDTIGADFVQKKFPMKPNFPPRTSQPPVGVVVPVKMPEDSLIFNNHSTKSEMGMKDKLNELKGAMDGVDVSPQTVPSFREDSSKFVKLEPASPEFSNKRGTIKRSVEDTWEDFSHLITSDVATKSKRRRCDSGSSGHTSEDVDDDENDFVYNMDDDSDDDLDADLAYMKPGGCESLIDVGKKQKQYFWQYNVQAKGPKGTRLKLAVESPTDPHVLNGFEDPVFDEGNTQVAGIRHGGKARKGDGNEVTPNPHKLFRIGHQLLRLNKEINACQLGSDVPLAKRNESRKEKNKLASRACRLKKKAQHEANKIKLHGLETEHSQINNVLRLILPKLRERAKALQNTPHDITTKPDSENSLTNMLTGLISSNLKTMVASHTTDYVNNVILTVERGDLSGGLNLKMRKT